MPHINRIRIANVRYDKGTRLISDLIFDPEDDNTIIIMPNGEGKTTIIQLVIQSVLPNAQIQGRKLHETLIPGSTGHVVVEWTMDGDEERYVSTGFCFNYDTKRNFSYFNYVFDYMPIASLFDDDPLNARALSINTLPLVVQNRPIGFQEMKDWLHENNIQVFITVERYKDKIREYRIVPEEWESIAAMNNDEAGASGVFEKAKSTKNLLENMLIPEIERMIYNTDEKLNKIVNIFDKHQEILLNLPIQKKNIKDFGIFTSEADLVLQELSKYGEEKAKLSHIIDAYRRLYKLFEQLVTEKTELKNAITAELGELKLALDELKWKTDSYPVFIQQQKVEEKKRLVALENSQLVKETQVLEGIKNSISVLKSYVSLKFLKIQDIEIRALNEKIRMLDQEEPELKANYETALGLFQSAWTYHHQAVAEQMSYNTASISRMERSVGEIKQGLQINQQDKEALLQQISSIKTWLDETANQKKMLSETAGFEAAEQPLVAMESINYFEGQCKARLDETKATKAQAQTDYHALLERIHLEKEEQLRDILVQEKADFEQALLGYEVSAERLANELQREQREQNDKAGRITDQVRSKHRRIMEIVHKQHKQESEAARGEVKTTIELERKQKEQQVSFVTTQLNENMEAYRFQRDAWISEGNECRQQSQLKKAEYEDARSFLNKQTARLKGLEDMAVDTADLYANLEQIYRQFGGEISQKEQQRIALQRELHYMQENLKRLEKDYFVPHPDLITIKHHLNDHGLRDAVLGSEWLAKLDASDAEKELLLNQFSLLPFSILVPDDELEVAEIALSELNEWISEIPILLMASSTLSKKGEANSVYGVNTIQPGLFVFQGTKVEVFISPDFIRQMRADLVVRNENTAKEEEKVSSSIRKLSEQLHAIKLFADQFPEHEVLNNEEKASKLPALIQSLDEKDASLSEKAQLLERQMKESQQACAAEVNALQEQFLEFEKDSAEQLTAKLQSMDEKLSVETNRIHSRQEKRFRVLTEVLSGIVAQKTLASDAEKRMLAEKLENTKAQIIEQSKAALEQIELALQQKKSQVSAAFSEKDKELERCIDELSQNIRDNQNIMEKLNSYIPRFLSWEQKKNELLAAEQSSLQLGTLITSLQEKKEKLEKSSVVLQVENSKLTQNAEHYIKDYQEFQLSTVLFAEPDETLSYDVQKDVLKLAKSALSLKQQDREALQGHLDKTNQLRATYVEQIVNNGLQRKWIDEHYEDENSISPVDITKAQQQLAAQESVWQQQQDRQREALTALRIAEESLAAEERTYRNQYSKGIFGGYDIAGSEAQFDRFKSSLLKALQTEKLQEAKLEEYQSDINALSDATKRMVRNEVISLSYYSAESMPLETWLAMNISPLDAALNWAEEIGEAKKTLDASKRVVYGAYKKFQERLLATENQMVIDFVRSFERNLSQEETTMFSYGFMSAHFQKINAAIEAKQKQLVLDLEQSNKTKEQIVEYCFSRASDVYKNIKEMSKNSKIHLYGRDVEMVVIDWKIEEDAKEEIRTYLDEVIEVLKTKSEGEERRRYTKESLSTRNLVNKIAPLNGCSITVFKPRKEGIVASKGEDYQLWDVVHKWSGGEKYAVYMTMFMIIVNHVRKQAEGRFNVHKTIVADNPFGKASSGHILKPIFEIAKKNRVKLICFTAHRAEEILRNFPTCYSLKGRSLYGTDVMVASKLEAGFVKNKKEP
ncbi:hypothetical protein [Paenibacillus albus]|uniref:Chromosome segregation ATPase n=1 Tax=Paenibacillus albus TaxID=2495582 RepID=A0A3Q8X4M6_9BACL|nr:hypothetical protein [Paenibacillus albus]AZN40409.1 hypothetical protein EJC50_12675 [Paenibacillus albus]